MTTNKPNTVTHRTKGNKKEISTEPEMKELKRMIRTGDIDGDRTTKHLKAVYEQCGIGEGTAREI